MPVFDPYYLAEVFTKILEREKRAKHEFSLTPVGRPKEEISEPKEEKSA